MLILNKNILTIGGNRLEGGHLTPPKPPTPPGPSFDEVTIGTQTWMSKNLDIDDGGEGIRVINNVLINNVDIGPQYYYTWDAAYRISNTISGWHLPSKSEIETLVTAVGGRPSCTKLKSTYGWESGKEGTDDYGFKAFGSGNINISNNNALYNEGNHFYIWESDTDTTGQHYYLDLDYTGWGTYTRKFNDSEEISVRLIKDT